MGVEARESAPEHAERAPRWEVALLVLLCAVTLLYWALQYQPFQLPNNDYYSFERTAWSFEQGALPHSFKRMPLFPGLIALLAPWLPGPHAELHAALLLNLLFSVGLLVAVFAFASRTLGRGAIVPVVLLAANVEFHLMALQPLVEPSYGLFVVLAFTLLALRSPWQYAAAGAAALSRYEAALLLPVLVLANALADGRWRHHAALAAAAAVPCAVWTVIGLVDGRGGGIYFNIMAEMGWKPSPRFLLIYLKEPFAGFYRPSPSALPVLAVAVGLPGALGLWTGWRRYRRETFALVAFFGLSVLAIVLFGVSKPRYAYPTAWIPILFFAQGGVRGLELVWDRARRWPPGSALGLAAAGGALLALGLVLWARRLVAEPHVAPAALDLAFAGLCVVLLAAFAVRAARAPWRAWAVATALFLVLCTWVIGGGLRAKEATLAEIWAANEPAVVLAGWIRENLGPEEGMVLLPRSHVAYLTGLDERRLRLFAQMQARTVEELAEEMRHVGFHYVAYTWQPEVDSAHAAVMYRAKNVELSEAFRAGEPLPGFRHVATLPLASDPEAAPVQIYRVLH